jgi:AraC-like DNA-binding protein
MADPCAEMVFHYKGTFADLAQTGINTTSTSPLAIVQGPSGQYRRFIIEQDFGIFGAYLYPHAITDLFHLSSDEIRHETPSIQTALGRNGRQLEEQILSAHDNNERVGILSAYLLKSLNKSETGMGSLHSCIKQFIHSREPIRINETAKKYCISARQLERKFKTITGFSPKTYSRITRFQHALNNYGSPIKSLTDLAYECGYYDQSHFIHDFKEFSGYEPGTYFAGKAEGIEYREN